MTHLDLSVPGACFEAFKQCCSNGDVENTTTLRSCNSVCFAEGEKSTVNMNNTNNTNTQNSMAIDNENEDENLIGKFMTETTVELTKELHDVRHKLVLLQNNNNSEYKKRMSETELKSIESELVIELGIGASYTQANKRIKTTSDTNTKVSTSPTV